MQFILHAHKTLSIVFRQFGYGDARHESDNFGDETLINLGNDVQYRNLCNREEVVVVDRNMSGKITLELPLVAERDFLGANGWCTKATPVELYLAQGTVAGTKFDLNMPQVQLFNPKPRNEAGILMLECDLHVVRNQFFFGFY